MEVLKISKVEDQIQVEGFPDAVKVIRLNGRKARANASNFL